ncbi:cytochrome P450-22 [Coleophoma crateriformis]|uniref:Cytochrome P450-22 n=1 Tax=Coleophoma crateriformis TaxID=565419 RepID=A0A3D8QCW3_9HELO|nr:cytochrome P450-22 [Coleophoma crateriformis]
MREIPNDGFIYYRSILNTPRVIITTPKIVKEICTRVDEFVKPVIAKGIAGRILGEGLVLSELDKHVQQRRVFLPIFAPRHIREMYPIFWGKTCELTQKIVQEVRQGPQGEASFEIGHWASRGALDIITMATLGEDFGSIQDENASLAKTFRRAIEPSRGYIILALLEIWLPAWFVHMLPNSGNRTMRESVPIFRALCRRLLRERRQQAAEKSNNGKDLLSLCFRYEEVARANEDEVIDQMTTFLAAGHETISVGITWVIYMLCLHPEWQSLLREEARANLPDPEANHDLNNEDQKLMATSADTDNMPMTQAFVNEVLRWYPPIPQTMREALQDTVIDGRVIPKGTWIVIPIKGFHRDERFWGLDANQFNPRRWLNTDGSLNTTGGCVDKHSSLAFMQGSRSCIAQGFSKAEMACVIGAWVGRFNFELVDPELLDENQMKIALGSLSARPLNGLDVKFTIVDGWGEKKALNDM